MRILHRVRRIVEPPHGYHVRRLLVLFAASVGLPRVTHTLQTGTALEWLSPEMYGVAFVVLAVALAITTCWRREQLFGRVVAGVGAVLFAIAAADAGDRSTTSLLVFAAMGWACLGEASTINGCD